MSGTSTMRLGYRSLFKDLNVADKDYKYLNKDFIIIADSATFNKSLRVHKFYKEKITTYRDSLVTSRSFFISGAISPISKV